QPLALPVFGRGRAMQPLVGGGINPEMITEYCSYLVGPCTCQVKKQNPGVDLLFVVDWDARIEGRVVKDLEMPPRTGLTPTPPSRRDDGGLTISAIDPPPAVEEPRATNWLLYRNLGIAVVVGLAIVGLFALVHRRPR